VAQGYLISAGDDLEVRLRARDGHNFLTIKQGGGLTRDEHETTVEPAGFARLWPLTEAHRIEKVRYLIPAEQGLTIELDAYAGALDGLITAEVEFDSEAQARGFTPPAWFGREVTGDPRYSNQRLADDGLPRVPAHEPAFSLDPGEPLGEGLGRLVREQIDSASEQLSGQAGSDPAEAVHEARKSFKRVRATLKLARDELQRDVHERELRRFRDAGRRLSSARDSQVLLETLDSVCGRFAQEVPAAGFSALREMLVAEMRAAEGRSGESAEDTTAVLGDLHLARRRLPEWRFQHSDIEALASGFERIYRQGLRAVRVAAADPSDEHFHELRKRSKELWYAAEILSPVAPEQMEKLTRLAHRLSELAGDDHDLAVLAERVRQRGDCFADSTEQAGLQMLIARRRSKLQRRALSVGARVYRSRPRRMRTLIEDPAH
jgi:CYTH domain-containing protein/CHAD domain-containing protein